MCTDKHLLYNCGAITGLSEISFDVIQHLALCVDQIIHVDEGWMQILLRPSKCGQIIRILPAVLFFFQNALSVICSSSTNQ